VGRAFRPANRVACRFRLQAEESRRPVIFRLKPEATPARFLAQDLNLSSAARAFALLYLAPADASIACWDAKYTFNFWRPITAIRNGDLDDNAHTTADPLWLPLFVTPQHPEYVSGHSTNSSAMATTLMLLFGDDPGVAIVATSPSNPGFERHWATLSEGVEEVIDARIYSGFHYRTADEEGARLGSRVARLVVNRTLRAAKHWD
jgi:PAP2 superfamily